MSGRLPRRVYWVRRLVVLVVPVFVAVVVVGLLSRGGSGEAAPSAGPTGATATPTGAATPTATPTPSPTGFDPGVPGCAESGLDVAVEPTADEFSGDATPSFRVTLTNTGDDACLVDAGQASRTAVVRSGDETVWQETQCVSEPSMLPLLLAPGQDDTRTLTWPRVRSAQGCPSDLPAPKAGTYRLDVTVDGVSAERVVFTLG